MDFLIFCLTVMVAMTIGSCVWLYFNNSFTVEPNNRERLVIQNIITGNMQVLGPGVHFRFVWWQSMVAVKLNREPVEVAKEEFRSANGPLGLIEYRYDIVTGREFNRTTGALTKPDKVDNSAISVKNKYVLLAVTKIDYKDREKRVQEVVSSVIESVLGSFESDELFRPSKCNKGTGFEIPKTNYKDLLDMGFKPQQVNSANQVYKELSSCIEALVNKKLTFTGINIVNFNVTNLKPESAALQERIEQEERSLRTAEAADALRQKLGADHISVREAIVATDPTAFAQVAKSQIAREIAKDTGESIARIIADGLKNFGKGP